MPGTNSFGVKKIAGMVTIILITLMMRLTLTSPTLTPEPDSIIPDNITQLGKW